MSADVINLRRIQQARQLAEDARRSTGGGSGGDAATLQGHPASDFALAGAPMGDATTLQGHAAAYFATAGHNHDATYAPLRAPSYASGGEPAAAAGWAGRFILVTQAAQPTLVKVCVSNSAGGYEWIAIAQSS